MRKIDYSCKQIWRLLIPDGAVGASEDFFDFFNATTTVSGAGARIIVSSVKVMVAVDVAVAASVGVNLHLHKTSAVGTSGTAATQGGTVNTAATFNTVLSGQSNLPDGITARLKPTGGATTGAWLYQTSVATDEGSVASSAGALVEKWLHTRDMEAIVLGQGQGLKVVQGTVASEGNVGFIIEFGLLEQ